ncbi:MAG: hypothetical protein J6A29_00840 [Clostridia bacterium]|nr:hypothetical protein [Clostridia bacterium]
MKRIKIISVTLVLLLMISISCYAAIDPTLHFDVSYEGEVKVNEEKNAIIILAGENAPVYTNVRVKVDIEGPAKPKLLATDSLGNELDIAELGYWGPDAGFTIGGTFSNETPLKATFTEAGSYTITLSLLNVQNANDILAQKSVTIRVSEDDAVVNEVINETINEITNEPIQQLPQTGTSLLEYTIYAVILFIIIYIGYQIMQRRK